MTWALANFLFAVVNFEIVNSIKTHIFAVQSVLKCETPQ